MIVLSSTDSIRVVTTSANALDVVAAHAINAAASFTPTPQATAIAAAATSTVVTAPAASTTANISHLSFRAKGGANTLTVQFFNGATAFEITQVALATGERLEYENGKGWNTIDASGQIKTAVASGIAGHVIRDDGVDKTQRAALNFVSTAFPGVDMAVADDAGNNESEVSASIAAMAANTVAANATAGAAAPTAFAVGTNSVLGRVAGNIVSAAAVNAQLAAMTANSIKGEATGAAVAPQDIAMAVQTALIRSAANIVAAAAAAGQVLGRTAAGGNLGFIAAPGGLLRSPQFVSATNAAFAHPTGTVFVVAIGKAGGGGGGGAVNSAASNITLGAGGASGGHFFHVFATISGTSNVTIGAAGAAGANTGAAAGAGGNTSVVQNAVTVTAIGGPGAPLNTTAGMAGVTGTAFAASPPALPPAISTNALLNGGGDEGGVGLRFTGTAGQSGSGGGGLFGGAGLGRTTQGAGNNAISFGGGGGGGLSSAAGGAVAGGAGGAGFVIFFEFG